MLEIHKDDGRSPTIAFTHSILPGYIDPHNVSTKKKPFSVFNAQPFSHTLDLLLPAEIYELVRGHLDGHIGRSQYAHVYMSLTDILAPSFFTPYIKHGSIMMRSEGSEGRASSSSSSSNVFSLFFGILTLSIDRATYEKLGLQGKPVEDGGAKHKRSRWVVEVDLNEKCMVHGKKGFGRLEWACRNVLSNSMSWLFYNAGPNSGEALREGREPVCVHAPTVREIAPQVRVMRGVLAPKLGVRDLEQVYDQENSLELLEWLEMVSLGSPRLRKDDRIDPFLSRYEVPDFGNSTEEKDIVRVRWRGFIPPLFVQELFLAVRKEGLKIGKDQQDGEGGTKMEDEKRWFAMSAQGFEDGQSYTVMQWAGRETLCWEVL